MRTALVTLVGLFLFGCVSQPRYVEGTCTQIGAYIPMSGQIYGLEVLQYLNGCKVTCVSNQAFKVDRTYSSTNDYFWGMVETKEATHTVVEVK